MVTSILTSAAARTSGDGHHNMLTDVLLCCPDPIALGALMEVKGEVSAALRAEAAAGAQGALQGSATSLSCCYFS